MDFDTSHRYLTMCSVCSAHTLGLVSIQSMNIHLFFYHLAPKKAIEKTIAFPCSVSVCEAHRVFLQSPRPLHQFNGTQMGLTHSRIHTTGMESVTSAA